MYVANGYQVDEWYSTALEAATGQKRDTEQSEAAPRCLYRSAQVRTAMGMVKSCADSTRADDIKEAVRFYDRIMTEFTDPVDR